MSLSCKPPPLGPPLGVHCFLPQVEASVFLLLRRQAVLSLSLSPSPLHSLPLRRQHIPSQSTEMEKVSCRIFESCFLSLISFLTQQEIIFLSCGILCTVHFLYKAGMFLMFVLPSSQPKSLVRCLEYSYCCLWTRFSKADFIPEVLFTAPKLGRINYR